MWMRMQKLLSATKKANKMHVLYVYYTHVVHSNDNDMLTYVFYVSATNEGDNDEIHNHRFVRNCFYKLIKARLLYFVMKRQLKPLDIARSQLKHIKKGY
ncbi:hypothetical protein Y032_0498g2519 [Ancylostoma ceylanicum]|uniref:Uncharacterized protein n=1 Tax=Ancylostoma ceylanicum TaxID=53326 RepID=A0A016WTV4_9BILA|nr:hypothetical protein Y032_0498g2519 [Ancylostoma ceylanicum]